MQIENTATVAGEQRDPDLSDNESTVSAAVGPPISRLSDLVVTKTPSTTTPEVGKTFTYTIDVRNQGIAPSEDVQLTDTMSAPVRVERIETSQGSCSGASSVVHCSLGKIQPGQTVRIVLYVTPLTTGTLVNTVTATSARSLTGSVVPGDLATVAVAAGDAPFTLTKIANRKSVRGGRKVAFKIRFTLSGSTAAVNMTVCDRLPAGLVFVKAPGASFNRGEACWNFAYLEPGATRTMRVVTRAERGVKVRKVRNVATASASNAAQHKASAKVKVKPAYAAPSGGVTG
jgi:uncharacterized repeat protein (TIGR01451 family)